MLDPILTDIRPRVSLVVLFILHNQSESHVLDVFHAPALESLPSHVLDAETLFLSLIFLLALIHLLLLQVLGSHIYVRCRSASLRWILLSFDFFDFFRVLLLGVIGRTRRAHNLFFSLELNEATVRHLLSLIIHTDTFSLSYASSIVFYLFYHCVQIDRGKKSIL